MSLNNSQLHGLAAVGTVVLGGALLLTTLYMTQSAAAAHVPPLAEKKMVMQADLARKSEKKKQPQKELKAPEPVAKPEGVSRDENKAPIEKKPDEPKKQARPDQPVDLSKFKHASDDDPQPGAKPTTDIGQFDGSERGFAPLNTGDPYWRELNADFRDHWEIPAISQVQGAPEGCFQISPDGTIVKLQFDRRSGDEVLDDSVDRAMKLLQKARNAKPQPVPTGQLGVIKQWVCFRFNPNS